MKIICIEGNYILNSTANSGIHEETVFVIKPETALLRSKQPFFIPDFTQHISPKLNVVLKISKLGKNIQEKFANIYYEEIGIGVDIEAKDVLENCKKNGLPWDMAKSFDYSTPIGEFVSKKRFTDFANISFSMFKNGEKIYNYNTSNLILSFDKIIAHISKYIMLKTGDYILTGSPDVSEKLEINDKIECYIDDLKLLSFHVK